MERKWKRKSQDISFKSKTNFHGTQFFSITLTMWCTSSEGISQSFYFQYQKNPLNWFRFLPFLTYLSTKLKSPCCGSKNVLWKAVKHFNFHFDRKNIFWSFKVQNDERKKVGEANKKSFTSPRSSHLIPNIVHYIWDRVEY